MNEEMLSVFEQAIRPNLAEEDDISLWLTVLQTLLRDIKLLQDDANIKTALYLEIGACSHWLRPHQTRWTQGGGFALPSGYQEDGRTFGRSGLPRHDWFVLFRWQNETKQWQTAPSKYDSERKLLCRISVPTRTARHDQAAVRVWWLPGSPQNTRRKSTLLYGFRKKSEKWECVASAGFPRLRYEPKSKVSRK